MFGQVFIISLLCRATYVQREDAMRNKVVAWIYILYILCEIIPGTEKKKLPREFGRPGEIKTIGKPGGEKGKTREPWGKGNDRTPQGENGKNQVIVGKRGTTGNQGVKEALFGYRHQQGALGKQ